MSKVKLGLDEKDDDQLVLFAQTHAGAMVGNANFTTPSPTDVVFDGSVTALEDRLATIATKEAELASLVAGLPALRAAVATNLNLRASYVELTSLGVAEKILTAAFEVQGDGTPTTSLPQPLSLVAKIGANAGEINLSCAAVSRAKSYVWECRVHDEGEVPGPWTPCKFSSGSKATATGLISGKKYAFRVRALGPNDIESPWSDEAISMAA